MKISYSKIKLHSVGKNDRKYIELLNCLLILDKYGIKTRTSLMNYLVSTADKILGENN